MRAVLLFTLLYLQLHSLEITISKGMEKNEPYSIINITDKEPFACKGQKDSFGNLHELICAFEKIPKESIKPVENDFFKLSTRVLKQNFFLIIRSKYKLYIKPIIFDLTKDERTFSPRTAKSKHWVAVGYKKSLPLIEETRYNENSLSFACNLPPKPLPYVGGLDLKGNPVHIEESEDVRAFVRVKKLFKMKKYEECIDAVDEVLQFYPNTLFSSELLYYKIKSLFKLRAYQSVLDLSKEYLHNYSSSENIPEILMMTAVAYYKNGQFSDADYFFDRLFSEHSESIYTKWGYIYKADMAVESGEDSVAIKYYKKALEETKSLDVAAMAAFKLARLYVNEGKYDKARYYLEKILKAKDDFFYKHYAMAKEIMFDLADAQRYLEAAKIDEAILKYMSKKEDEYEANLRYLGLWLSKTPQKRKAIAALDRYIKEFKDGMFIEEIEKTRDSIFFSTDEKDDKKLLAKYDALIERYGYNDPIGQRALYEKVKLMLQKKMYSDVLQLKEEISGLDGDIYKDKDALIEKAALGLMEEALKNKECQVVLDIQHDYNITVSSKWDFGLYDCFVKAADFVKAKKIAKRNLSTNDIELKKEWLYRYAKVAFATSNYSETIDVAKDLLALVDDIKKSKYKEIYRLLFDAYERTGNFEGMVRTIQKIEELFGLSYKDIDRYVDMINAGVAKKDDNIIIKYGKKLYDLQQRIGSHAQSPFVEFALYQAYMNKGEYKKAFEVISSLDNVKLSKKDRARQKYLKGAVLEKLWRNEEAKKAYKEAIEADPGSAWAKLAKSALELD